MKNIVLSNVSNTPIYKQLYNHLISQILNKDLKANDAIPSIRLAAKELKISVITVKKAWDDLENDGFIYTIPGKGSFVADLEDQLLKQKKSLIIKDELAHIINHLKAMGIDKESIVTLIEQLYQSNIEYSVSSSKKKED